MNPLLSRPGSQADITEFAFTPSVIQRGPLTYTPASTARPNHARLPHPTALCRMDLAYRHQPFSEAYAEGLTAQFLIAIAVSTVVALCFGLLMAVIVPPHAAVPIAAAISVGVLVALGMGRALTLRRTVLAIVAPGGSLLCAHFMHVLFAQHSAAVLILAMIVVVGVLFALLGNPLEQPLQHPLAFYEQWLYTHHRLRPATRDEKPIRISWWWWLWPVSVFGGMIPLLAEGATFAFLIYCVGVWIVGAVVAVAIFSRLKIGFARMAFHAIEVLAPYATYGLRGTMGAFASNPMPPGSWTPLSTVHHRRRVLLGFCVPLVLMIAGGTRLFTPDLVEFGFGHYLVDPPTELVGVPYLGDITPLPEGDGRSREILTRQAEIAQVLRNNSFAWIPLCVNLVVVHGQWHYALVAMLSLLIAVVTLPLVFAALFDLPALACLAVRYQVEGAAPALVGLDDDGRTEFDCYRDRLVHSSHVAYDPVFGAPVREAEHIMLGVEPSIRFPILLSRKLLERSHVYVTGPTGAGKTALSIMSLAIHFIRGHRIADTADAEECTLDVREMSPPPPMLVIDGKGDMALFNTLKHEAERRQSEYRQRHGITDSNDPTYAFKYFTIEHGRSTHVFNPFQSLESKHRTITQLCQIVLESLSLWHGMEYGPRYFSNRARYLLLRTMQHCGEVESFTQLYEALPAAGSAEDVRQAFELVSTIHAMTHYPMLEGLAAAEPRQCIDMPAVLEHRQIVYAYLPAAIESAAMDEIGKMMIYCLQTAAHDRRREGLEPRHTPLIIDEFQRFAGANFRIVLEQARSAGITAVLANQSIADLKKNRLDLRDTIRTNCGVKQFYSASSAAEMEDIAALSGDEVTFQTTVSGGPAGHSVTHRVKPRLDRNELLAISDHPTRSVLHVARGEGYTQFAGQAIALEGMFPLSHQTYLAREQEPWPEDADLAVVEQSAQDIEEQRQVELAEQYSQARAAMAELLDTLPVD